MSKREFIVAELDHLRDQDLDTLIDFLEELKRSGARVHTPAAESALSKDWMTPEEDAAWADL
jgi:hypothetical protein